MPWLIKRLPFLRYLLLDRSRLVTCCAYLLETGGTTAGILHGCTAVDRLVETGRDLLHVVLTCLRRVGQQLAFCMGVLL
jgi:hypothetical protein